jgi:hypothetical protein
MVHDLAGELCHLLDEVVQVRGDGFDDQLIDTSAGIPLDLLREGCGVASAAAARSAIPR